MILPILNRKYDKIMNTINEEIKPHTGPFRSIAEEKEMVKNIRKL